MLRLILVFGVIVAGVIGSIYGPFGALLFYLWNAYFRPEQWLWVDYVSPLNLSLFVGIYLVARSVPQLGRFRFTRQSVLVILFLGQTALSMFASAHWDWVAFYWIEFLKIAIITLLIPVLVVDLRQYRMTLLVIGFSLGLEAAKQGWAQLLFNPGAINNNPHPVLGDNNGVAVGILMLVPLFVALAQTAKSRWEKYVYWVFIVGLLYRGLSTYSRGGFLTAIAVGLMAIWRSPRRVRGLIAVAILATMIYTVMPDAFWDRMQTIDAPEQEQDGSVRGRLYFWSIAVRMANSRPLTGVGINDFENSFPTYDFTGGVYGGRRAVHSAWFGVLAETGYPGLVLFVLLILGALRSASVIRTRTRGDPNQHEVAAYASALQGSLVAYVVGTSFINGQYSELFWHMTGLCLALEGISVSLSQRETAGQPVPRVAAPLAVRAFPGATVRQNFTARRP